MRCWMGDCNFAPVFHVESRSKSCHSCNRHLALWIRRHQSDGFKWEHLHKPSIMVALVGEECCAS